MKRLFLMFVLLLVCTSFVNAQSLDELPMTFLGTDGLDVIDDDITKVWVGQTPDYLAFVIQFDQANELGTTVNITVQDSLNVQYLLSAGIYNGSYTVTINRGLSLNTPGIATDNPNPIQYIEQTIYFNPNLNELGVYFYWDDIGGQNSVDFVIWNDSDLGTQDRAPDSTSYRYMPTLATDRILDFSAALLGNFEALTTNPTDVTLEPDQTTLMDTEILPEGVSENLIFVLLSFALIFLIIFSRRQSNKKRVSSKSSKPLKVTKKRRPSKSDPSTVATKFIAELGRDVRMCCFQTARLEETYCYCGRVVQEDIKSLFKSND